MRKLDRNEFEDLIDRRIREARTRSVQQAGGESSHREQIERDADEIAEDLELGLTTDDPSQDK